ncbi:MAG: polysaccharide biosynthesis C-terminal domain-containing protein [Ignavibacteria bacterium]|nr:polysaccharide biosynthesis C-terminal domain-containing protein [Ignavibacteria bacterium]
MALSYIIVSFFDFGLPVFFQRDVSQAKKIGSAYKTSLLLYVMIFPLYFALCFFYAEYFQPFSSVIIFIAIALSSYLSLYLNMMSKIVSGMLDFKAQFYFLIISRCLFAALPAAYFLNFNVSIESVVIVLLLSYLLNLIFLYTYIEKNLLQEAKEKIDFKLLGSIIKISIPLGIIVLVNLMYDRVDVLLISKLLSYSDTGKYNIAYGLLKASTLSFSFILIEGFSKVSYLSRRISSVSLFLKKYAKIVLAVSAGAMLILFFAPEILVVFFYSAKYAESSALLKLLSFAVIPLALNNLTGIALNALGKFNFVLIAVTAGLITNVALNIILIPKIGLVAACYSTIITEIVVLILESAFLVKVLRYR